MACKLSKKQGIEIMERQRIKNRWSKYDSKWLGEANVSVSTLKRFWGVIDGGVREDTFIIICEAAGLNDVIDRWDELAETVRKDSTCPKELKSFDDMETVDDSTEISSKTCPIFSEEVFTLRIRSQITLTQPEQNLVNAILEDLKENLLNGYTRLNVKPNPITASSQTHQYSCTLKISGYVSSDNKSMFDEDLDELKHHTGIDDSAIKWTSPEQQKDFQFVS
ncbi:MAG: hypothetical protein AB4063_06740 [Crocosphaera sp.]